MSTSFWVSLFVASPAVSTSVAIGTSVAYDNSPLDVFFDNIVENHIEPTIATTTDWTIEFIDNGVTTIRNLQESITDRIEELSD